MKAGMGELVHPVNSLLFCTGIFYLCSKNVTYLLLSGRIPHTYYIDNTSVNNIKDIMQLLIVTCYGGALGGKE